jgi:hypothetical protein
MPNIAMQSILANSTTTATTKAIPNPKSTFPSPKATFSNWAKLHHNKQLQVMLPE